VWHQGAKNPSLELGDPEASARTQEVGRMKALEDYGPIRKGNDYRPTLAGYDWFRVRACGHIYIVPAWVFRRY
jgi:hypothetical protein